MKTETNVVHHGDCIDVMQNNIKSNTVDLVFADPPYNLSGNALKWQNNKTGGDWFMVNENWDRMSNSDYIQFTSEWLGECSRVLKYDGSIYVSCSYHNVAEVLMTMKALEFKINNLITWYKSNSMPNMTRRVFTHCTEFVVWGVRGSGWCFNYEKIKVLNPERQKDGSPKQMRDLWQIPLVQGKERLRGDTGRALHPTQKPKEMLKRIILASSEENDIVLDPFLGTGTTIVVAQQYNRRWIGIENDDVYVKVAKKRMGICEENELSDSTT